MPDTVLCEHHPPPTVFGTLREWRALCPACPAVWRSSDVTTPAWVREHAWRVLAPPGE